MANFVTDGSTLPTGKVDADPPGVPPNEYADATEWNEAVQASLDIRTFLNTTLVSANVLAFGADPTGAADSTSAFNDAIATIVSGGTLLVPGGIFKFDGVVTASGIIVKGNGIGSTVLNMSGSGQLVLAGSYARLIDCSITSSNTPTVPSVSLADNTFNCRIRDCLFTGCLAGAIGSSGLIINLGVLDCVFTGCAMQASTSVINVGNGSSTTMVFERCYLSNNNDAAGGQAMTIGAGDPVRIRDCWIESSGNALLLGTTGAIITGCYFEYMVGTTGCIVHGYTFNAGAMVIRDCFFSIYAPWTTNLPLITCRTSSVLITGCYFNTNPYEFASANGITVLAAQAAMLDRIVMHGNTTNDNVLSSQINGDADQVFGSADRYTNMVTHSSFEDGSHVTVVGGIATATQAMSGYLGNTSQQLAFNGGGSGACEFTNAVDSGTAVGDTYTISFYAKVTVGSDVSPDSPLYLSMLDTVNGVYEGWYGFCPSSVWKRFVFQTLPAKHTASHTFVILPPQLSTPPTVTVLIDGLQMEKNARRPHPLATTIAAPVTVGIVNTNAT